MLNLQQLMKTRILFFCKPVKRGATANSFNIVDNFMKGKGIKWSDCVAVCRDAAPVMTGK
jgi:hypothetical protein